MFLSGTAHGAVRCQSAGGTIILWVVLPWAIMSAYLGPLTPPEDR